MVKQITYDSSVEFTAVHIKGERLTLAEGRKLFDRALAMAAQRPETYAWIEFVRGGVVIHWLEPENGP